MEVKSLGSVSGLYQSNISANVSNTSSSAEASQAAKSADLEKNQVVESMDPQTEMEKTKEDLDEAVEKLNKTAGAFGRSLQFQVHDATNRTMVSVVDTANDKVIRQYPSEEVLDMVAKVDDYLGLIFDKKA